MMLTYGYAIGAVICWMYLIWVTPKLKFESKIGDGMLFVSSFFVAAVWPAFLLWMVVSMIWAWRRK